MVSYADTGFLISLYLPEGTTSRAEKAIRKAPLPVAISPLTLLELRNALNFAILRGQLTTIAKNEVWRCIEQQMENGFFQLVEASQSEIHEKARTLSDKYTPLFGTRSLDLLHVAAALLISADLFLSFDERQCRAASGEGLKVDGWGE